MDDVLGKPLGDRALVHQIAQSIVESPMGAFTTPSHRDLAAEVLAQREQILFIAHAALTAAQSAVPHDARIQMLHEISAACRGEFPSWWPAFKAEHKIGESSGR